MAKKKYIDLINSGVENWNEWRANHQSEEADLSAANLHGCRLAHAYLWKTNLEQANLTEANLFRADLSGVNLAGANLQGAHICEADLRNANLSAADLRYAKLSGSNLQHVDLQWADLAQTDLTQADLSFTNLTGAELYGADLNGTILAYTIFGDTNLSESKNLKACLHRSQSIVDPLTLRKSGHLPEAFLRGCGLTENFIQSIPALFQSKAQERYYSCYISYSHMDKVFVQRLYKRLQSRGIRCWLDEKQLLPGDPIFEHLSRGIGLWDKVLLCCSRNSCSSLWVDRELTLALAKEEQLFRKHGRQIPVLIPLNMDNYIFSNEWKSGKRDEIRSRLAANFVDLKIGSPKFNAELEKVIRALRSDKRAREKAPRAKFWVG